jgi:O-methyltransferase
MPWKNDQVSEKETEKILALARKCLSVEGDYVEFGCYKGDTSLMLAELLVENSVDKSVDRLGKDGGKLAKKLWIYDSFEGLPEKTALDDSVMGTDFKGGELFTTKREVKERFLRAGLPVPVIKKAWFKDLTDKDVPGAIAFAFLDGDFYESIRDSLKLVASRMTIGGVLVVHDYTNPALPGVRRAIEEWRQGRKNVNYNIVLL